jgi:hypothetical protein
MDSRKTRDFAPYRRRSGVIRQLSDRQLDVKELFAAIRETNDKTIRDGLAANLGYPDDVVTAVVLARIEDTSDPAVEIDQLDLILAGSFLDHLDTLGFCVVRK